MARDIAPPIPDYIPDRQPGELDFIRAMVDQMQKTGVTAQEAQGLASQNLQPQFNELDQVNLGIGEAAVRHATQQYHNRIGNHQRTLDADLLRKIMAERAIKQQQIINSELLNQSMP